MERYKKKEFSKIVYAINITTGKIRKFNSVAQAAGFAERSASNLRPSMLRHKPLNGWVFGYEEDFEKTRDAASFYKRNGEYAKIPIVKNEGETVDLRIDKRTVIKVSPEKATEKYAEEYRKKLKMARRDD